MGTTALKQTIGDAVTDALVTEYTGLICNHARKAVDKVELRNRILEVGPSMTRAARPHELTIALADLPMLAHKKAKAALALR